MKCNLGDVLYRSHDQATLATVSNEWEVTMVTATTEQERINGMLITRHDEYDRLYRLTNRLTGAVVNQSETHLDMSDTSGWFWYNQGKDDV